MDRMTIEDYQAQVILCPTCKCEEIHVDCWNCAGSGYTEHDCGEDTCACLNPIDDTLCEYCKGNGGFMVCPKCNPEATKE